MLEARNLSVSLGGQPVLHGVDAAVAAGVVTGLVGANGSGKSTLLKALAGLLPASRGGVFLDGTPLESVPPRQRARRLGYLPQNPECHWPLSVGRVAGLGRLPWRGEGADGVDGVDGEAVAEALRAVDALHLRDRVVSELSGGERARVHLARVLAGNPALFLIDEPCAGLDPFHQLQTMELLRGLARGGGSRGVLVVLHDLGLAARFCDRLVLLREGRLLAAGPPGEVLAEEPLARAHGIRAHRGCHAGEPVLVPWERVEKRERGEELTPPPER